ncbi:DNA glycosylase [Tricharina praecox]|uniref:DNA glycosylase n=1 Tax=Tricharina praecox TaxID=43433 RepID=UPI00221F79AB|nr:DNA glycosylase [Tricharina praecox]KAI5853906.1 DNA glycosylase [Tricharina praecox]
MQIEDIDGDIRLEEGVTEEIIVPSGDPQEPSEPTTPPPKRRKSTRKSIVNSPYFTAPRTLATVVNVKGSGRTPKGISVTPWPPFTAEKFGLVQEELRDNPFHLLISTTFLNRTKGSVARPLLDKFLSLYPTPEILSTAPQADLETLLQPIGLYRVRAERLIKMATEWLVNPPGAAEKVLYNYPAKDTPPFPIPGREPRGVEMKMKWEIAHLPGVGAYALDSWRIFCRDALRGGVKGGDEEWRSVVPKDKELRAYCRWMWAKDGVVWEEEGDAYAHRAGQEG